MQDCSAECSGTSIRARPSVVIADDHAAIRDLVSQILEPEFRVIASVENGEQLIHAVTTHCPDAAVVDISMPLLTGIDAVRRFPPGSRTVVVFLSGQHEMAEAALEAGGFAYVKKLNAVEDLIPALRKAVGSLQLNDDNLRQNALEPRKFPRSHCGQNCVA